MSHSVENHLCLDVKEYDRLIRTFSPAYDEMLSVVVDILNRRFKSSFRVLDLGTGTGALAFEILSKIPHAHVEVWDIDKKMLAVAQERLAPFHDRLSIYEKSFEETSSEKEAIVASFSLHHIKERSQKQKLFKSIFNGLSKGGLFLNADLTLSTEPELNRMTYQTWSDFLCTQGWAHDEAQKHFLNWSNEDQYFPLFEELNSLAAVGFREPECFWKKMPATVYGGIKT
jgi:tRNA (cmo5U34)-methyltransferase